MVIEALVVVLVFWGGLVSNPLYGGEREEAPLTIFQ